MKTKIIILLFLFLINNSVSSNGFVQIVVEMPDTKIVLADKQRGRHWNIISLPRGIKVLDSFDSSATNALELRTGHCDGPIQAKYCEFELISAPMYSNDYGLFSDIRKAYLCFYKTARRRRSWSRDWVETIPRIGRVIPAHLFIKEYHDCLSRSEMSHSSHWQLKETARWEFEEGEYLRDSNLRESIYTLIDNTTSTANIYISTNNASAANTLVNYDIPLSNLIKGRGFLRFFFHSSVETIWRKAQNGARELIALLPLGSGLTDDQKEDLEGLMVHIFALNGKKYNTKDAYVQLIKTYPSKSAEAILTTDDSKSDVDGLKHDAWRILKSLYGIRTLKNRINELRFERTWTDIFVNNEQVYNYTEKPLEPFFSRNHFHVWIESRLTNSDFNKSLTPDLRRRYQGFDSGVNSWKKILDELQRTR
ncbi:MAG: hypothetical protein HOC71_13220 [Candidatus Latescibacteria bacterium]|jgi:hypothetical protein|nr:hypothetical protein [Candidatus Latescibacterota bacterium]